MFTFVRAKITNLQDSTMAGTKRARNVCHACKLRKKACDKGLPACGFCTQHRQLCRYDSSAPKSIGWRSYNPGRRFVSLQSLFPPSLSPEGQQDHALFQPSTQSIEESVHQLAQGLTKLTNLTYDDIIDLYFQGFHEWLPVISPDSLRRQASRQREEECPPAADFTVLILAMWLIVLPSLDPSLLPPLTSQDLLYTATKSAFAQAQGLLCTSLRLVQAALLIALREYAGLRPEAAYITLVTCAGLARVLGIKVTSVRTTGDVQMTSDFRLEKIERGNLAWAIAILER